MSQRKEETSEGTQSLVVLEVIESFYTVPDP